MPGRLYGLGVGPGDPELLTLKALRQLRSAPGVAYPAPEQGESFASSIAEAWLEPRQCEIPIAIPMRPGSPPVAVYDAAAEALAAELEGGQDVASAGPRDRARRDRHRPLPRPLRPQLDVDHAAGGGVARAQREPNSSDAAEKTEKHRNRARKDPDQLHQYHAKSITCEPIPLCLRTAELNRPNRGIFSQNSGTAAEFKKADPKAHVA